MKEHLLFLGPPGAGKGTQAEMLCDSEGFLHLSTGELLRSEVSLDTELGREVAIIMNNGELVSDEIVFSIVKKNINKALNRWLLDGFPRNIFQAERLQNLLEEISQPLQLVILIEVNDQILIERLLTRGREDDNEEVIKNRLEIYRNKTAPLIDFYTHLGILQKIEGNGGVEDVALAIKRVLN